MLNNSEVLYLSDCKPWLTLFSAFILGNLFSKAVYNQGWLTIFSLQHFSDNKNHTKCIDLRSKHYKHSL